MNYQLYRVSHKEVYMVPCCLSPSHPAVKSTCLLMTSFYAELSQPQMTEDISAISSFLDSKYLNFIKGKCHTMHACFKEETQLLTSSMVISQTGDGDML